VAYLLYGTLAAAYGLSVWAIIRQRRRGERAPRRATAPEIGPREALAQQRAWARFRAGSARAHARRPPGDHRRHHHHPRGRGGREARSRCGLSASTRTCASQS